ncbi:hypothetical protein ACROYT_G030029 [Oculina patagonica]
MQGMVEIDEKERMCMPNARWPCSAKHNIIRHVFLRKLPAESCPLVRVPALGTSNETWRFSSYYRLGKKAVNPGLMRNRLRRNAEFEGSPIYLAIFLRCWCM